MTTYIITILIFKISGNYIGGIITAIILTFYTEFMIFSSVFYSPVIMLFLLSCFLLLLYIFYKTSSLSGSILSIAFILIVYLTTFLFKPELIFLPFFLILLSLFFIKKDGIFFKRTILLSAALIGGFLILFFIGSFHRSKEQIIANDFVFFGHTDYGGDGGEGSFVYPENEIRYKKALSKWLEKNNITQPEIEDINRFQRDEIIKFITESPYAWIKLQFTKFFRTFGIVPETSSFMILYTGLFKGNLWLTSIIVVAPVALIVLLFIFFFNISALKRLFRSEYKRLTCSVNKHLLYVYFLLFFYYIIATVFFGQYSERYRLPVMVVFIIPLLGYFIASFDTKQFFNRVALTGKCIVVVLFITIWVFQAKKAISNKARLKNAIESVIGVPGIDKQIRKTRPVVL
jgi:hypothetical protein